LTFRKGRRAALASINRFSFVLACCTLLAGSAASQAAPKVSLDTSETIFTVLTAINTCGYDQELSISAPLRQQVRSEVAHAAQSSDQARTSLEDLCTFYRDHRQGNQTHELAQYISLALNLGPPPTFTPTIKEADLPPDASYIVGIVPRLQRFYIGASVHQIWESHKDAYEALLTRFHEPVSKLLLNTDLYLRMSLNNYSDRRMIVFLDPMAGPGQVNARNYGTNYYMVIGPSETLRLDALRHTYLHFILDPLAAERATSLSRLAPVMDAVQRAPMDEAFKTDIPLLVTESLIRAIEGRITVTGKTKDAEAERIRRARQAAEEGFVLTPYFDRQLAAHEKSDEGFSVAYPNWLHDIDVDSEKKFANHIQFAASATPEDIHATLPSISLLQQAQKRLATGDTKGAAELAQQALDRKHEDPGQALFILAQVSTFNKDMNGARSYFGKVLEVAHEPRLIAWSHIYLGRISDLRAERDQALEHYHAALQAGDTNPATRQAAERGIKQPYEPPAARVRNEGKENDQGTEPDSKK
jgi:hypothetical protein